MQRGVQQKVINNRKVRKREFKALFRNAQKLRGAYRAFEFFRGALVSATNRMNLAKVRLANQVLALAVYADALPVLASAERYARLSRVAGALAGPEDEGFNREFFCDALVPENFRALDSEEHNPIFAWVEQYAPLEAKERESLVRALGSGPKERMARVAGDLERRFEVLESCAALLGKDFRDFEARFESSFRVAPISEGGFPRLAPALVQGDMLGLEASGARLVDPNSGSQ